MAGEDFDTVVMKFGGSSVADPDKIRHVAQRLVEARERGDRVVGTISAMGKTTDSLLELAREVSPHPHPRELARVTPDLVRAPRMTADELEQGVRGDRAQRAATHVAGGPLHDAKGHVHLRR